MITRTNIIVTSKRDILAGEIITAVIHVKSTASIPLHETLRQDKSTIDRLIKEKKEELAGQAFDYLYGEIRDDLFKLRSRVLPHIDSSIINEVDELFKSIRDKLQLKKEDQ